MLAFVLMLNATSNHRLWRFYYRFPAEWNGAGVRDSCGVYVRHRRLKAEEAHGPLAESECLQ
ncbi:hypothetical protein [Peribacillus muralis]|uniref:hypothetical protein n=1 Tax=Peribacillus muralis TaxID=264697 RepID=UPI00366C2FF2